MVPTDFTTPSSSCSAVFVFLQLAVLHVGHFTILYHLLFFFYFKIKVIFTCSLIALTRSLGGTKKKKKPATNGYCAIWHSTRDTNEESGTVWYLILEGTADHLQDSKGESWGWSSVIEHLPSIARDPGFHP